MGLPGLRPVFEESESVDVAVGAGLDPSDDVVTALGGEEVRVALLRAQVVLDGDVPPDLGGLDDIAVVSRAISAELDRREHLIGGSYTLEVTSPGVDRPLTGQRHWRRAHLRQVAVRLHDGTTFTGRVGAAGDEAVTVLVDGRRREVRYADVAHAGVQVEFRPAPEHEVALLQKEGTA